MIVKTVKNILEFLILLWGAIFVLPTFLAAEGIVRILAFFINFAISIFKALPFQNISFFNKKAAVMIMKTVKNILKFLILLWGAIFVLPTFLAAEGIVRILAFFINPVISIFRKR